MDVTGYSPREEWANRLSHGLGLLLGGIYAVASLAQVVVGRLIDRVALKPLYLGVANDAQAQSTARVAQEQLLTQNGLQTTLLYTGQQWDAPNGWAPLQWMAVQGLLRYGHAALAQDIASRWLGAVHRVYLETGRLLEKYDVTEFRPGGGGEYATQDGFGWTNATYVTLLNTMGSETATK